MQPVFRFPGKVSTFLSGTFITSLLLFQSVQTQRLVDFQVAQPPPLPKDAKKCTVRVLERTFAFSFGDPEILELVPPTDCGEPGTWAGISLNFTVTSNGTQFDRLGIFTFQNIEIWRTSTPEPTRGDGIIWTYLKDVTRFLPLFSEAGTFILQLDNLIQTGLNGEYATTLDATYFESSDAYPPAPRADLIVPLTTLANDTGNDASIPPGFSLNVTLPRNAVAAYAEMQASGNSEEETWYYNIPNNILPKLPSGTGLSGMAFGNGPFRELRLLVDNVLAGAALPYAAIFTGGIVPTAWRPITSYGAVDLPTYHLDLTPFIPILTDGEPHNITIDVVSAESNHTIDNNWFVSGLLQVLIDRSDQPTVGRITAYEATPFARTTTVGNVNPNGDVRFTVNATRNVHIESEIIAGSGARTNVVFDQRLEYTNTQTYLHNGSIEQIVGQTSSGITTSVHNSVRVLTDEYNFPLAINLTFTNANFTDFQATVDHAYNRDLLPAPFILGSTITAHQVAGGNFSVRATGNTGSNGTSSNTFSYVDTAGNSFFQQVSAFENRITLNTQSGSLAPSPLPAANADAVGQSGLSVGPARLPHGTVVGCQMTGLTCPSEA
ncbi:peptide N-acetyl-beta-D-glucosaminyl asparaginase amidase A-domain-containing protein [Vararia minispora EC-137]|uniref:Peptide N-acetyl-beta-D-glucosaminyl asparaginase amidase A-domain-containing protein n=1 Tax=Vararia minispora EC-137 TaxID=1314806 RepID=A0ACB8QGR5_9AGAM|nr:peptide N-acetyl-beta-D-glucosaminyl asparaginase amidase A-domain-containing protein [Vararia minispora EC-137]